MRKEMKNKNQKAMLAGLLALAAAMTTAGCGTYVGAALPVEHSDEYENAKVITLNTDTAVLDGESIKEYNYTWHISPDSEKAWYEGDEPSADDEVYIAHDIQYYPQLDEDGFTKEIYDGEMEWTYHYTAEGLTDYLFSTLPVLGNELPTEMMHSEEEAYANKVLHITKAGTYILQGDWNGQIYVDLGDREDTFSDPDAKVTLVLNGVDVTCDCAPAVIFYSVYECDNEWEAQDTHSNEVSTADAGAKVEIMDGTVNNFTGANVYRLLKAEYKKDSDSVQKKAYKVDGAFYSFVSLDISGGDSGIMNVTSTTFEGLDSELHLTINSGNINIYSQDDAINVNEDDVSVFTMNGGTLHIFAGLGAEGDGIDSNGYIVINDGTIAGGTPSGSDSLLDSDCGTTQNGGKVLTIGSNMGNAMGMGPGNGMQGMEPPEGFDRLPNGEDFEGFDRLPNGQNPEEFDRLPNGQDSEDFEWLPKDNGSNGQDSQGFEWLPKDNGSNDQKSDGQKPGYPSEQLPGGSGSMEQLPKGDSSLEQLPGGGGSMEQLPKDSDELEELPK